jgi:hypothetical protein
VSDGDEVNVNGSNPNNADTDLDGLPDKSDLFSPGLSVLVPDTDGDTFADGLEVLYGSDPNLPASLPDMSTPVPLVNVDATGMALGPATLVTNNNVLGWNFRASSAVAPIVEVVDASKALSFYGTNFLTGIGAPPFMALNASRSVDAWIWNPAVANEETVAAWGARGADGRNSAFSHGRDAGFGALQFWGGDADVPWGANAGAIVSNTPAMKWTHVAYTYNNATGTRACYVNGALAHSETSTNVLDTFLLDQSDPRNQLTPPEGRSLPFRIGAQNSTGAAEQVPFASMAIAKVRAYDQALSAAQIAAQYNAEKAQFPGAPVISNVGIDPVTGFLKFDWVPSPGQSYAVETNNAVDNAAGWGNAATGLTSGSYTNDHAAEEAEYIRLRVE